MKKRSLAVLLTLAVTGVLALDFYAGQYIYQAYKLLESADKTNTTKEVPAAAPATTPTQVEQLFSAPPPEQPIKILPVEPPAPAKPLVILGKKNTLIFRDVVTRKSISVLQKQAIEMSQKLTPSDTIYLVLETPGGEVESGLTLIDSLQGLPQKVKTITLFAASMGFHIVQNLDERLITQSGILMSHRIKVSGISGEIPGEAVVAVNNILRISEMMDTRVAKRMQIPLNFYQELIRDEWWVMGQDTVDSRAADKVVQVRCGTDLSGTYKQELDLSFMGMDMGTITLTWSECPLIAYPISVGVGRVSANGDKHATTEVRAFIDTFIYNKEAFVRKYISTGDYKKFIAE